MESKCRWNDIDAPLRTTGRIIRYTARFGVGGAGAEKRDDFAHGQ